MNSSFQILTRRDFLSRSTQLAAAGALAALTDVPFFVKKALADGSIGRPLANGRVKKLLFVFLRGGNDSLNSVAPLEDDAYARNRPTIALQKNPDWSYAGGTPALWTPSGPKGPTYSQFGIPLGNGFAALHPALKFMVPAYNSGELAVIHRVAYPKQSRSHFDSQVYWETGVPSNSAFREGILYRTMLESGLARTAPLTGVSFQSSLPMILRGSGAAMTNLTSPERYDLSGIPDNATGGAKADLFLRAANQIPSAEKRDRELLQLQYGNLSDTLALFQDLITGDFKKQFRDDVDTDGDRPYNLFPDSNDNNGGWKRTPANDPAKYVIPANDYGFIKNLKSAAVVLNKTDAIVAGTQLDGFDTHSNQGGATGSQARLLQRIGWALYALKKYFSVYGDKCRWEDVVVVTLSEFGRTSKENNDNGTDHAEANVMWVAGGGVKGYQAGQRSGVFNCGPSDPIAWNTGDTGTMFGVEKRYLKRATDYRSVLGEIIRDHLGASQEQLNRIIPGYAQASEVLEAGGTQTRDNTKATGELGLI